MGYTEDQIVIGELLAQPEILSAEFFRNNHHRIKDDALYWNCLGTLWKAGGTVLQQDSWKGLFQSKRPKPHKVMKNRERKRWRRLPKIVTAYRAINNDTEATTAISWTLSKRIAEQVFSEGGRRPVVSRVFDKKEIFAFFDRRGEDEILVNIHS